MPQRTKSAENPAKAEDKAVGEMVPGKNGGMIWRGTPANIVPGPGRPPSAIRETMRQRLDEEVLGDLMQKYAAKEIDALGMANFLAKYGLGEKNEMTLVSPDVKARVQATVNLIAQKAPQLLDELEELWK